MLQHVAAAAQQRRVGQPDDGRLELVGDLGGRVGRDDQIAAATRRPVPSSAMVTASPAAASARSPLGARRCASRGSAGRTAARARRRPLRTRPATTVPSRPPDRPRDSPMRIGRRSGCSRRRVCSGSTLVEQLGQGGPRVPGHRGGALADVVAVLRRDRHAGDVPAARAARPASGTPRRCARTWPAASATRSILLTASTTWRTASNAAKNPCRRVAARDALPGVDHDHADVGDRRARRAGCACTARRWRPRRR